MVTKSMVKSCKFRVKSYGARMFVFSWKSWYHGTMVPWHHGTMAPWHHGTMVPPWHGTMVPGNPPTPLASSVWDTHHHLVFGPVILERFINYQSADPSGVERVRCANKLQSSIFNFLRPTAGALTVLASWLASR